MTFDVEVPEPGVAVLEVLRADGTTVVARVAGWGPVATVRVCVGDRTVFEDRRILASAATRDALAGVLAAAGCDAITTDVLLALDAARREAVAAHRAQRAAQGSHGRESQATQLVALAGDLELYHTPGADAEAYCDVRAAAGHRETYALDSRAMRRYLAGAYYRAHGGAPTGEAVREALAVLEARALHDGTDRTVGLRVAEHAGALYLDLADSTWRAVEVTVDGWALVAEPPVRFRRPRGMLALPEPARGGTVNALRRVVRVTEQRDAQRDWWLLVGWLLAALRPRGPYPVLALHGEPGAAKTTTARILRSLVDPSVAPVRAEPREERDLIVAARAGHLIGLDNVSRLSPWLSDALCRLATGGGYSARELYSDLEQVVVDVQRPVILTGIAEVCTRSDLADRAFVVTLPPLLDADRRPERDLWTAVEAMRPAVLGALLDAVARGLRDLPGVHLATLPRMADYAEWVTACEPALGCTAGALLDAYAASRAAATETVLEGSAVAGALQAMLAGGPEWEGTPSALLAALEPHAPESVRRDRYRWPQSPRGLSGELRRLGPALRAAGIDVEHCRETDRNRRRMVRVATVRTVRTVRNPRLGDAGADGRRTVADGCGRSADGRAAGNPPASTGLSDGSDGSDGRAPTLAAAVEMGDGVGAGAPDDEPEEELH